MLGSSEALVDILLYVEERKDVDPATGADEELVENLDALGRGFVVAVSARCSAFPEGAGSARGRRDLDMQSGPRRASRCSGLGRSGLKHNIETTVPDRAGSR